MIYGGKNIYFFAYVCCCLLLFRREGLRGEAEVEFPFPEDGFDEVEADELGEEVDGFEAGDGEEFAVAGQGNLFVVVEVVEQCLFAGGVVDECAFRCVCQLPYADVYGGG